MVKKKSEFVYRGITIAIAFVLPFMAVRLLNKKSVPERVFKLSQEYVKERYSGEVIGFPEFDADSIWHNKHDKVYIVSSFFYTVTDSGKRIKVNYTCELADQPGDVWLLLSIYIQEVKGDFFDCPFLLPINDTKKVSFVSKNALANDLLNFIITT